MRAVTDSSTALSPTHERTSAPLFLPTAGGFLPAPIPLSKGAVCSRQTGADETLEIRVLEGSCWITLEGDPEDYVVESGSNMFLSGTGLVVAEGLSASNAVSFIPVLE